ncbi:MAG TPA: hypothetical protein VF960_10675 [Chloroflexota bacterium]
MLGKAVAVAVGAGVAVVMGVETALVAVGLAETVGKVVAVDVGFPGFCAGSLGAASAEAASTPGAGIRLDTRLKTSPAIVIAQTTL